MRRQPKHTRCQLYKLIILYSSDIFDEQLRKQYLAKAPEINPLGDGEEESQTFGDLDVFTKVRIATP